MEYEKAYVFKPDGHRPAKRRRIEPEGLQASWPRRRKIYKSAWESQREALTAALDRINAATTAKISTFLEEALHTTSRRIPAGIVVSGPGNSQLGLLGPVGRPKEHNTVRRIFVSLSSNSGTNLKALLKVLIQKATAHQSELDDEEDELQNGRRRGARLLNYDLQLLHDHVLEHRTPQVVVAFEDSEAFDGGLLSDLVELLGSWQDRIPFVCLFNIATSVDFLQRTLSRDAIMCLNGALIDATPSGEEQDKVFEACFMHNQNVSLGAGLATSLIERHKDHIQSIVSFVDAVHYAFMSHHYANALSIFRDHDITFQEVPDDHLEAVRNVDSFMAWGAQRVADEDLEPLQAVLEDPPSLCSLAVKESARSQAAVDDILGAIDIVYCLQQHLPNTPVSAKSDLYVQAMSNKMAGSALIRSLLLTIRKIPSDVALHILRPHSLSEDGDIQHWCIGDTTPLLEELEALVISQKDATAPLRSEEDVKNSTFRTTVVAKKVELSKQKSELSKQDAAYTSILRRLSDRFEAYFNEAFVDVKKLLFHELWLYDLKSPHREVFTPRPRHAVERALALPHDYLDCECCRPEKSEGGEASLAASQPATAVLYQLYLESGSLINASDLWQAFQAVLGDDKDEKQTMALFQRALAELKYLGLVKMTRKRVDHIAKVGWRGL